MPLPASGAISLSQIQTEFGGANPISMSEYYRGGAYTTSNNTGVPTSGQISMSQFHGTSGFVPDPVPDGVAWDNIDGQDFFNGYIAVYSNTQTITGINQSITLRVNVPSCDVNCSGASAPSVSGTFTVLVNGSGVSAFTHSRTGVGQTFAAKSCDFTVTSGQTVQFFLECSYGGFGEGSAAFNGTAEIWNLSNGNAVLDTVIFTTSAAVEGGLGDPW